MFESCLALILFLYFIDLQEMQKEKHKGQHKFTTTVEAGEHLYPSTSTEGREIIRQQLCSLRDLWENYTDGLDDAQRKLESALVMWSTYNDSSKKLINWVKDMEGQLSGDLELLNNLDEKKGVLQKCKVSLTSWGPNPDISGFETSGHSDHQMSSPVVRTATIVRLADSLIICCYFETILRVFL